MKLAIAELESVSPVLFGRYYKHEFPETEKEQAADYDSRTWRNRCHTNAEGFVIIPPLMLKNCVCAGAKRCNMKIPGQKNATYTKNFLSGILCLDPIVLPIRKEEVKGAKMGPGCMEGIPLFVPSGGQRGGGTRVWRTFPIIHEWKGEAMFHILDEIITEEVFRYVLEQSGAFVGIGAMRVGNGGITGRFKVNKLEWAKM